MITGMHAIVFSAQAEKVRAFFADVLGLPSANAGGGWLIFALPPAELAVHPADGESRHELYLMCDDIHATLAELTGKGAEVARDVSDRAGGCSRRSGSPTARSSPSTSRDTRRRRGLDAGWRGEHVQPAGAGAVLAGGQHPVP